MKSLKLILPLLLLPLIVNCAGETLKSSAQLAATPALPSSAYFSTRNNQTPAPESCPASDKSWRKENNKALLNLANICSRLNKSEQVHQMGQLLAQRDPNSPWGAFFMGVAAEQMKEYARALWMTDLAIKKSPHTALLYYQKARVHWQLGEYSAAVANYNTAIKENPRFVDAHLFLAQLYFRDQDFSQAAQHFTKVIELEPSNSAAVVGLAETKIISGHPKEAVELYEQAVNLNPRNINSRIKLARLYEETQKDLAQALSTYKKLKTLVAESRTPVEDVSIDINEKISRLENLISQTEETQKKVTKSESLPNKKVKK